MRLPHWITWPGGLCLLLGGVAALHADGSFPLIFPEQRHLEIRDPSKLPKTPVLKVPAPPTVSDPRPKQPEWKLSLDEAIRVALANSEVVRVLAGTTATASGSTIYDPAIINTQIDQALGRFDPTAQTMTNYQHTETPQGVFVTPRGGMGMANRPPRVKIEAPETEVFHSSGGLSQTFITGGTASLNYNVDRTRIEGARGLPLNPQTRSSTELNVTQPLLQGGGIRVNLAPVVIARLDTERSFFQLKDSVQELVRGVIDAYWGLVFARTDTWARRQQVDQGREALARAEARFKSGFGSAADVAQSRESFEMFRATLISSQANLIQQEAVLRNIMGLPPSDQRRIVPASSPATARYQANWARLLDLAEQRRPDLIELKLVIEADDQRLLVARNGALPRLDLNALYRWNGLEGTTPSGREIEAGDGRFTDWQIGVNFSVPLGLRQARAMLRQQELVLMRDWANLRQGLHNTAHLLAADYRNTAQFYEQYLAYRRTQEAARYNLNQQMAQYRVGRTIYVNVLQAITDWGNAVSQESQSLTRYNTELANLERQTGTILETHGIRFVEERYRSIGPLGRWCADQCYPRDVRPGPNAKRHQPVGEPGSAGPPQAPATATGKPTGLESTNLYAPATVEPTPPADRSAAPSRRPPGAGPRAAPGRNLPGDRNADDSIQRASSDEGT